jgi:phage-related protein
MALQKLPTTPYPNTQLDHEWVPNTEVIRFGDGYTQRYTLGINAETKTYTLQYTNLTKTERDTIYNFIVNRKGRQAFAFQLFGETAWKFFICYDGLRETVHSGQFYDLEFTMEEVKDIDTVA